MYGYCVSPCVYVEVTVCKEESKWSHKSVAFHEVTSQHWEDNGGGTLSAAGKELDNTAPPWLGQGRRLQEWSNVSPLWSYPLAWDCIPA